MYDPSHLNSNPFQYSHYCNMLQLLTRAKPSAMDSVDSKVKRSNPLAIKGTIPTKICEMLLCKTENGFNSNKFKKILFCKNYIEYHLLW